jgi:hypothetical protein
MDFTDPATPWGIMVALIGYLFALAFAGLIVIVLVAIVAGAIGAARNAFSRALHGGKR